jgi:predicted nucleic acid-binding Zn ribbon protein
MVDEHKHCPGCGRAIPLNETVCSPECAQIIAENRKKVQKTRRILYIVFAAFILVWLYFTLTGRLF